MLIDHNEICHETSSFLGTSWNVGFNEYLDASECLVAEKSFAHLILALEALLIDSNSELNYRVALYAAIIMNETYEERLETFNLIKKAIICEVRLFMVMPKDLKSTLKMRRFTRCYLI